jgi:serine/threonine protein kinase/Tfp pilus assembly protein PilF
MKCPTCLFDNPEDTLFCGRCGAQLPRAEDVLTSQTRAIENPLRSSAQDGLFAGKYRICEELGRGGMGVVYKAEDTKLKRWVALKFLPPELTRISEAKERFMREAQAAAGLDHQNICAVYEVEEFQGQAFIAMTYIKGQSLKARIAQGPLGIKEAVDLAIQVAEGLKAAHEKGVVHRDIKPANIMLTEKGQAKIMDFGLARMEWAAELTRTATVMGTVAYMSPEQARGERVDHRTDIWALGCTLFEMLTGRSPFRKDHEQTTLYAIMNENPPPLSGLRQDIPARLEKAIGTCLSKDPRDRYSDVGGLIAELKAIEKGDRATPAPSSSPPTVPSLAVLPFADMSPQKDQGYFCEGLAEEMINTLAHIKDLRVVARTSAFVLRGMNLDVREIGRILNVKAVLEGSIRKSGHRLRITAQLVKVEDGFPIWSEKFDRKMDDIFAIQDEIAMAIVNNLKIRLLANEVEALEKRCCDSREAYNLYLKGLHFASKPSPDAFQKALQYFREAIDTDPGLALAYAGMARVYAMSGILSLSAPREILAKAKTALRKALELDENLAEAHAQTALMAYWFEWDWEAAERSYKKTFALNPGNAAAHAWYAWLCVVRRRFSEAIQEIKLALSLDPLMPLYYAFSVGVHGASGKPDEAIQEFQKVKELDPNFGLAYFHLGVAYIRKGMMDEAIQAFQKSRELALYRGWAEGNLGSIFLAKGEKERTVQILGELLEEIKKSYVAPTSIGLLYAALGDTERAFEYFERACEERDSLMIVIPVYIEFYIDLSPALSSLKEFRDDPRFKALLKKMGLDG